MQGIGAWIFKDLGCPELAQERAYMMLRMNGGDGSDFASSDGVSYEEEEAELDGDREEPYDEQGSVEGSDYGEDAFDANESGINPEDFDNDEEYARALQDAEERDVAVRLMALAGLNDCMIFMFMFLFSRDFFVNLHEFNCSFGPCLFSVQLGAMALAGLNDSMIFIFMFLFSLDFLLISMSLSACLDPE